MDCCGIIFNAEQREAKKINKMVEKKIRQDKAQFTHEYKLLILGTGESGKSTFLRQIKIIHGQGYTKAEKLTHVSLIRLNVYNNLQNAIDIAFREGLDQEDKAFQDALRQLKHVDWDNYTMTEDLIGSVDIICDNCVVSAVIEQSCKHKLPDSTEYFLSKANRRRILSQNYVPELDDIVRLRVATTGIVEFYFEINNVHFRLVDVGGQRSERKKWIHCFENVTAVIFLVSLSEYDQTLAEDPNQNRMIESLALFKAILSHPAFSKMAVILFLNKIDLFEKKITVSPLNKVFPEYQGHENVNDAKSFILKKFMEVNPTPQKPIYSHFTCATDTQNIKFVFEAVKDTILRQNLSQYNLI